MLDLPLELFLIIAADLNVADIISLRKTCRSLFYYSHERTLWLDLLCWMQTFLPLPHSAHDLDALTSSEIERIVLSVLNTERLWLVPREYNPPAPIHTPSCDPETDLLVHLEFVFDDYLLAVYKLGQVYIWDTRYLDSSSPGKECGSYLLAEKPRSCVTAVGADNATVFIGIALESGQTAILSSTLWPFLFTSSEENYNFALQLITTMDIGSPSLIHDINVEAELVLFSRATDIRIFNWRTQTCYTIGNHSTGELLNLRNNLVKKLKFLWPYVLCLRSSSISVYDLRPFLESMDSSQLPQAPILVHELQYLKFMCASLSNPWPQPIRSSIPSNDSQIYRMSLVGHDANKGLFLHRIVLDLSPTPSLSVNCIDVLSYGTYGGHTPNTNFLFPPDDGRPPQRIIFNAGNYVENHCLSSQGCRGLWIERLRNSEHCILVAFSVRNNEEDKPAVGDDITFGSNLGTVDRQTSGPVRGALRLNGRMISTLPSTIPSSGWHILSTFSEATGKIAIGSQSIQILTLNDINMATAQ